MKRWDGSTSPSTEVEDPRVDEFLAEIEAVCRRYNMCIGHEDGHGAFQVHKEIIEDIISWLKDAHIAKPEPY